MRLSTKLLLVAALLAGISHQSIAFGAQSSAQKKANAESRKKIRRYSFRGGVPFSPRGYGIAPTREATSKARSDYAPFHGGNYIP